MKKVLFFMSVSLLGFLPFPTLAATQLNVPFILQAPKHNWSEPWQDACEEASVLMVNTFYQNQSIVTANEAAKKILEIVKVENTYFGYNKDTNASETTDLINNFLPYEAQVVANPTIEDIKNEIDNNQPAIVPLYGKALQNKYFRNGGPDYHMIVISGYDEDTQEFIVQDPGFGKGHNFRYGYGFLLNAVHDFLPNKQTKNGSPVAIFTTPQIKTSGDTDGDGDNLTKNQEIKFTTSLLNPDTDGDGYTDNAEAASGYSPLVAENRLHNGTIIKIKDNNRLYLLENHYKKHLVNPLALKKYGRGKKITIVSEKFLNNLSEGPELSQ